MPVLQSIIDELLKGAQWLGETKVMKGLQAGQTGAQEFVNSIVQESLQEEGRPGLMVGAKAWMKGQRMTPQGLALSAAQDFADEIMGGEGGRLAATGKTFKKAWAAGKKGVMLEPGTTASATRLVEAAGAPKKPATWLGRGGKGAASLGLEVAFDPASYLIPAAGSLLGAAPKITGKLMVLSKSPGFIRVGSTLAEKGWVEPAISALSKQRGLGWVGQGAAFVGAGTPEELKLLRIGHRAGLGVFEDAIKRDIQYLTKLPFHEDVLAWQLAKDGLYYIVPKVPGVTAQMVAKRPMNEVIALAQKRLSQHAAIADEVKLVLSQDEIRKIMDPATIARVATAAEPLVDRIYNLGLLAANEGLLDPDKFFANAGMYLPRLYETREFNKRLLKLTMRRSMARFREKKIFAPSIRRAMGELVSARQSGLLGMTELANDIEITRYYKALAGHPELVSDVARPGFVPLRFEVAEHEIGKANVIRQEVNKLTRLLDTASDETRPSLASARTKALSDLRRLEGWDPDAITKFDKQIAELALKPQTDETLIQLDKLASERDALQMYLAPPAILKRTMGPLAGKFVHPDIAAEVHAMGRMVAPLDKPFRWLFKGHAKGIAAFKWMKLMPNPAAHFRNFYSNTVLADFAGLSPIRLDIYAKAAWDLKRKTPMFREAVKAGALRGTFTQSEIEGLQRIYRLAPGADMMTKSLTVPGIVAKTWQATGSAYHGVRFGLEKLYRVNEEFFKMAVFRYHATHGVSSLRAARIAQDAIFDYSDVPPLVHMLRSTILPFATWPYKAIPRVIETAATRPYVFWKYLTFFSRMKEYALNDVNMTAQEYDEMMSGLPDYVGKGAFLLMPHRREDGSLSLLDLTYILPWGDIHELAASGISKYFVGNPLFLVMDAIRTNRHPHFDMELYNEFDDRMTKASKVFDFAYKMFMPALTPGIGPGMIQQLKPGEPKMELERGAWSEGGYSFDRLMRAMKQIPSKGQYGHVSTRWEALKNTMLGIKILPVDPEEAAARKAKATYYDYNEVRRAIKRQLKDRGMSKEAKAIVASKIPEKMRKVRKKYSYEEE